VDGVRIQSRELKVEGPHTHTSGQQHEIAISGQVTPGTFEVAGEREGIDVPGQVQAAGKHTALRKAWVRRMNTSEVERVENYLSPDSNRVATTIEAHTSQRNARRQQAVLVSKRSPKLYVSPRAIEAARPTKLALEFDHREHSADRTQVDIR
jgi:hypothetical protein